MSEELPPDHVICPGCAHHFHAVSQESRWNMRRLEDAIADALNYLAFASGIQCELAEDALRKAYGDE